MIPFYFKGKQSLMGMQLFLSFDNRKVEVLDVESGRLKIDSESFLVQDNSLSLVWYDDHAIDSEKEDALFYVLIRSNNPLIDDVFKISELSNYSEIYESSFDARKILLERQINEFQNKLYQNVPNPFSSLTTIEFELSKDSQTLLKIYDTNGQLVKSIQGVYKAGKNNIVVRNDELNGNGIYYYQLETESFSSTRKMIFIE